VVALRDAGAHFVTTFGANPGVATWLDGIAARQHDGIGPEPDVEGVEGYPNIARDDAATPETAKNGGGWPAEDAVGEAMSSAETSGASS
jgi:hypothetical protein